MNWLGFSWSSRSICNYITTNKYLVGINGLQWIYELWYHANLV